MEERKKILVTGLAGKIGGIIRKNLSDKYLISGLDLETVNGHNTTLADLSDLESIKSAFEGIDTVVHLAADPNHQGGWETNLANNIVGTRNVTKQHGSQALRESYLLAVTTRWDFIRLMIIHTNKYTLGISLLLDNQSRSWIQPLLDLMVTMV